MNPKPQSSHEKTVKQTQREGLSAEYLTSASQNRQAHQKKGRLGNWRSPEAPKKTSSVHVGSWVESWTSNRALGRSYEIQIDHGVYLLIRYQYWFISYEKGTLLV